MKRLLLSVLLICPPALCCEFPANDGTSEPRVQDQGTDFAPETASMTENTPSGSWDNGGITDNTTGGGCWSSYDN